MSTGHWDDAAPREAREMDTIRRLRNLAAANVERGGRPFACIIV